MSGVPPRDRATKPERRRLVAAASSRPRGRRRDVAAPQGGGFFRRRLARFAASASGATAVEFAMLAVPFLLLIFGTAEYGRLMWTREALQQTAIAGARCMGMTQTSCGSAGTYDASMTQSFVIAQGALWAIPLTAANITLNNQATCGGVTGFSQVSLAYTFSTLVPKLITALAGNVQLSATACFPKHR